MNSVICKINLKLCFLFSFQKPRSEAVRQPLRTLVSSASRLQIICKNAVPADPKVTPDHQHLTQQVIACAYEIAKAAKQLVTCYQ